MFLSLSLGVRITFMTVVTTRWARTPNYDLDPLRVVHSRKHRNFFARQLLEIAR
jgi:hypothetical protein